MDSNNFRFFGVVVSDKTLTYLMGLQLLWCDGWHSAMAGIAGMLCGVVYSSGAFNIDKLRFPRPIRNFCEVRSC